MREISQRTLVRMMERLAEIDQRFPTSSRRAPFSARGVQTHRPSRNTFWSRLLIEHGFNIGFVNQAEAGHQFNWDQILRALHTGDFYLSAKYFDQAIADARALAPEQARTVGEEIIQKLAALLVVVAGGAEPVKRSLELDGFSVDTQRLSLVPFEGPISEGEEASYYSER